MEIKDEILDKHGAGIYRWGDFDTQEDAYVFRIGSNTREAAIKAMEEYATIKTIKLQEELNELQEELKRWE